VTLVLTFAACDIARGSRAERKAGRPGTDAQSSWLWLARSAQVYAGGATVAIDGVRGGVRDERARYMDEKLLIERSVTREFVNRSLPPAGAEPPAAPKIAFLFLLVRDFPWGGIWDAFFDGAPRGAYSIYVHQARPGSAPRREGVPLERWGAVRVERVASAWCACFGAEVAMLWAALQDPGNAQFVFLSDQTVPLKRFAYVHRQLVQESPTTSKFCLATAAEHDTMAGEAVHQELRRQCLFRDFLRRQSPRTLKHHQWVVLARRHAATIVRRSPGALDLFERSWRRAAPDIRHAGEGCSDECAPLAALLHDLDATGGSTGNTWIDLTRLGVEQQCLTFVHWRNCFGGTPLDRQTISADLWGLWSNVGQLWEYLPDKSGDFNYDFMQTPLKRDLNGFPSSLSQVDLGYLQTMANEGFMFARKFSIGANVTTKNGSAALSDVLPQLWYTLDEDKAGKRVWTHLETMGLPTPLSRP